MQGPASATDESPASVFRDEVLASVFLATNDLMSVLIWCLEITTLMYVVD